MEDLHTDLITVTEEDSITLDTETVSAEVLITVVSVDTITTADQHIVIH